MPKQSTGQPVRSAERMLAVLEMFSFDQPALSVAEVSAGLGLATSTVRRLLNVLEAHGFVRYSAQSGKFAPDFQVVRLAAVAVEGNDLLAAAGGVLDGLRQRTSEACQLTVLSGGEVVFVDRRESQSVIRIFSPIGFRSPAWDGRASGKALMAWLPADEVEGLLPGAEEWQQGSGPNAADSPAEFLARLAVVREQGYAVNDEETERDVWAVAAPVRDHSGRVVAAVNVPVLKARVEQGSRARELTEAVVQAAEEVSRALGSYRGRTGRQS
ncbi:IclR family transcriptional regulator [Streptomyces sp. NPDC088387]|uniref:IclR family transcriptional regulator n=1 Tax=Streptomyces sp. NPDC088387 TaxID=3365859 RepID=UPI00381024E7